MIISQSAYFTFWYKLEAGGQCEYSEWKSVAMNVCILKVVQSSHINCILYKVIQILIHKFV